MAQNLFEELQGKKQQLIAQLNKATEFGWISPERQKEYLNKLQNDILTIGVIGQMKCGKSTFLNSFVFEDDVLPAATTPMTAALSVITYGTEKRIVAEFYTNEEWEEQRLQASRSLEDVAGNTMEESKVKAAKELVSKASKLGGSLQSYLGKTQEDCFDNLIEYVGADGKYISITKSVTIYYPKEYLKGVEIVDTPGFNDPIVSREERTKSFLEKADVVVMMLYAGRPFDATDRNILFQNVRQCGTGKVIIGINKYDIPYENGETEDQIKDYVKAEIKKACREYNDDTLVELLKEAEPIPLSAEMALLSELPMSKISSNDAYKHAWNRSCSTFEISSQREMKEKSHFENLTNAIKQVINTEKDKVLFTKPRNAIISAGNTIKEKIVNELSMCESKINDLNKPDDELEEKYDKLKKAEKRLKKKIDNLGDDIDSSFSDLVRRGTNSLEDKADECKRNMIRIIDGLGRSEDPKNLIPKLNSAQHTFVTRTLKRSVQDLSQKAKNVIDPSIAEFLSDIGDILVNYVDDFDNRDFIKGIRKSIQLEITDKEVFTFESSTDEEEFGFWEFCGEFLNGLTWGLLGRLGNAIDHNDCQYRLKSALNEIFNSFDPKPYLNTVFGKKEEIIKSIKEKVIDDLLDPMIEQLNEIRSQKADKEKLLTEAQNKLAGLRQKKQTIEKQLQEIV